MSASRSVRRLLLGVLLVAAGCGQGPPAAAPGVAPKRAGTAVIGVLGDVENWNPYLADSAFNEDLLAQLYPTLAVEQTDYREHPPSFAPALAESWEWSPDGLVLTFHLRENARWSDGAPVTSADVVFTWKTQVTESIGWPGAVDKATIERVDAKDEHTVLFHFRRRYPYQLMDANEGLIVPAHAWSQVPYARWEDTDWSQRVLAAGPFRLAHHTPQQEIVLEPNPSYWLPDRPLLDRVVLRVVPSQTSLFTQFRAGDLDFIQTVPPHEAEGVRRGPRTRLVVYPDRQYAFVAWNNAHPLLRDPRVRRALTQAIDRQAIVDTVRAGFARVAVGPILSGMWACNRALTPLPFDPQAARALLAAAGFVDRDGDGVLERDGARFELELLTNGENQERRDIALLVQRDLARVGVKAEPRFLEWGALLERQNKGPFDAIISSWREYTKVQLEDLWHTPPAGKASNNFVHYSNPEVDALIDRADQEADFAAQKPLLDRIQELIVADQPYTFLYEREATVGLSTRVGGAVVNDATPYFNLDQWTVQAGR